MNAGESWRKASLSPTRESPVPFGKRDQEEEVAQESLPDNLDQSPAFFPTEPERIPEDDFDQSRGA